MANYLSKPRNSMSGVPGWFKNRMIVSIWTFGFLCVTIGFILGWQAHG